jgi:hypothetical protein
MSRLPVRTGCARTLAPASTGRVLARGDNQFGQGGGTMTAPPAGERRDPAGTTATSRAASGVTVTSLGLGSEAFSSFAIVSRAP